MVSPAPWHGARLAISAGCLIGMFAVTAQAQSQIQPPRTQQRVARRDSEDLRKLIETQQRDVVSESIFYQQSTVDLNRVNPQSVRTLLTQFADEVNRLYQQIQAESRYNGRLRTSLADTGQLRARASLLAQDARTARDLSRIASGIRELDSDWRVLSHDIKQMPQVPNTVSAIVTALDRTGGQIGQLFQIEPQLDRRALLNQVMAMQADFDNLIDDIELEMGSTAEAAKMIRSVRSIRTQAAYSADLIADQGEYARIVEAYQRAETEWRPLARELTAVRNRYIERSVRRIVSAGNELKKLLWLDNDADITDLINAADSIRSNVDEFFKRTPLLLMVKLENPQVALQAANSFYDACDVYTEQVREDAGIDTLMEVFKDLQMTGNDFLRTFEPLPSRQGQLVLSDINRDLRSLQELAQSHYGGDGFDLIAATDLAAEIATMSEHIDFDLRQWMRNTNDSKSRSIMQLSNQFKSSTNQLSVAVDARRSREEIRQRVSTVYQDWRRLTPVLARVPEEDKQHMASINLKLADALYHLMLPLDL